MTQSYKYTILLGNKLTAKLEKKLLSANHRYIS